MFSQQEIHSPKSFYTSLFFITIFIKFLSTLLIIHITDSNSKWNYCFSIAHNSTVVQITTDYNVSKKYVLLFQNELPFSVLVISDTNFKDRFPAITLKLITKIRPGTLPMWNFFGYSVLQNCCYKLWELLCFNVEILLSSENYKIKVVQNNI